MTDQPNESTVPSSEPAEDYADAAEQQPEADTADEVVAPEDTEG
jgi:hypothetical protein